MGVGGVGAVEVGAAGDDQAVPPAQLAALGLVGLAVAGVVDLDAVQLALRHQLPHQRHALVDGGVGEHQHPPGRPGGGDDLLHRGVLGAVQHQAPGLPAEQPVVHLAVDAVRQAQLLQRLHDAALEQHAAVPGVFQRLLGAEKGVHPLQLPGALQAALVAPAAHGVAVGPQLGAVLRPVAQQVHPVPALVVIAGQLHRGDQPHPLLHRVPVAITGAAQGVVVRDGHGVQPGPRGHGRQPVDGRGAVRTSRMIVQVASHGEPPPPFWDEFGKPCGGLSACRS